MANKVGTFFRECYSELKLVEWPTRANVISSVKIVIVSTVIIAILLGLLDAGFTAAFRAVMR